MSYMRSHGLVTSIAAGRFHHDTLRRNSTCITHECICLCSCAQSLGVMYAISRESSLQS